MLIRQAVEADVKAIMGAQLSAVLRTCSSAYPPDEIAAWTAGCNDPERYLPGIAAGRFMVAILDEVVAGFYDLDVEQAELRGLFVDAGYAGRGIGSALLKEAEAAAARHGIRRLRLDSTLNAIRFYRAHGFALDEMSVFRLRSGVCLPCGAMHKDLDVAVGPP